MDSHETITVADLDARRSPSPDKAPEEQPLVQEITGDLFNVPDGSALIREPTSFPTKDVKLTESHIPAMLWVTGGRELP